MMLASFLGGSAIGSSFVGFVHPLSLALSVNYGTKHTLANCIIMKVRIIIIKNATKNFKLLRKIIKLIFQKFMKINII